MTNIEKYNNAFCEAFEMEESKPAGLKYQAIDEWDSVGHMSLIANLEEAFDIMMEMDDIIDLVLCQDLVQNKMRGSAS